MIMKDKTKFIAILTSLYISGWLENICSRFTNISVDEAQAFLLDRSNFKFVNNLTVSEIELFIFEELKALQKLKNNIIL